PRRPCQQSYLHPRHHHTFPTRRSSDLTPAPEDSLERFRLHFRHPSFDAKVSSFSIDGEYLRQRRSARKNRHGFSPQVRLNTNDRDRKSTRLNSSHQIISYAVFCLKKKK